MTVFQEELNRRQKKSWRTLVKWPLIQESFVDKDRKMFEKERSYNKVAESLLPTMLDFRTFLATINNIYCSHLVFPCSKHCPHTSFARLNVTGEDSSSGFMAPNNPCQAPGINGSYFTLRWHVCIHLPCWLEKAYGRNCVSCLACWINCCLTMRYRGKLLPLQNFFSGKSKSGQQTETETCEMQGHL